LGWRDSEIHDDFGLVGGLGPDIGASLVEDLRADRMATWVLCTWRLDSKLNVNPFLVLTVISLFVQPVRIRQSTAVQKDRHQLGENNDRSIPVVSVDVWEKVVQNDIEELRLSGWALEVGATRKE